MKNNAGDTETRSIKKTISMEPILFIGIFAAFLVALGSKMGALNMLSTMMNTAYRLLMDTVFYIMAIAVVAGALAELLTEFGVIALMNKILSPLMKPLYGLPGASIVGVFATYLSDNPAILTLANDRNFKRYFKKYQLPVLTNIGTAFGMGLIITAFMAGIENPAGGNFIVPALIGNFGAAIGSIVSVRLMLLKTKKIFGTTENACDECELANISLDQRSVRTGSIGSRFLEALLEGGKTGVNVGLAIIPGVLIICTFVLMLTNGPSADGTFTGGAYEGIGFLPWVADKIDFIIAPLFGFSASESLSVPITALGAAGAAIGLVPGMVSNGLATANDIAVFTAMCMCWSGYLSTHVAMMDSLRFRELTGHAIISHTIGGICAGTAAHLMFVIIC